MTPMPFLTTQKPMGHLLATVFGLYAQATIIGAKGHRLYALIKLDDFVPRLVCALPLNGFNLCAVSHDASQIVLGMHVGSNGENRRR